MKPCALFAPMAAANGKKNRVDGIELTWALNHLNYFLLTELLLDVIRASAPARIVNVSSEAYGRAKAIQFDDVEFKQGYNGWTVYGHSKLANVMFTYELARRLEGTKGSILASWRQALGTTTAA